MRIDQLWRLARNRMTINNYKLLSILVKCHRALVKKLRSFVLLLSFCCCLHVLEGSPAIFSKRPLLPPLAYKLLSHILPLPCLPVSLPNTCPIQGPNVLQWLNTLEEYSEDVPCTLGMQHLDYGNFLNSLQRVLTFCTAQKSYNAYQYWFKLYFAVFRENCYTISMYQ